MLSVTQVEQIKGHKRSQEEVIISCLRKMGKYQTVLQGGGCMRDLEDPFGFRQVTMAKKGNQDSKKKNGSNSENEESRAEVPKFTWTHSVRP